MVQTGHGLAGYLRLIISLAVFACVAPLYGQQGETATPAGIPEDWTHHHLIFSNPGTAEDARYTGYTDHWYKVTEDPRFRLQQLRRSPTRRSGVKEAGPGTYTSLLGGGRLGPIPRPARRPLGTLKRDWSMSYGGSSSASNFATVGAVNSSTVSASSVVTINGTALDASAPVTASQTGNFTGNPTSGQTVTIGGTLMITASPSNNTGTNFQISGTGHTTTGNHATDLAAAIVRNGAAVGVTASSSGAQVTVTATAAGSSGNRIALLEGLTGFAWTGTTLANGTDGTQDGTNFSYWSGSTYASAAQVASNIASTINANSTLGALVSATSRGNTVYVAGLAGGTTLNGKATTVTSFGAVTWNSGTLSGGGTGVAADIGAEIFPAKYSFNAAPQCSDFVAYTTGVTGSSAGPTIVAYNNLYEGASPSCGTVTVPSVYWSYNTAFPSGGGSADSSFINTSPVLSFDGEQVAFMQTTGSAASLVLLKWAANSSLVQFSTSANNVLPANYPACIAPCMTRIGFNTAANDLVSSPFYDYGTDILYVGDASGKLHQFIHVFAGTGPGPSEVLSGGWPVSVAAGALTSPVYDAVSGLVFVGNGGSSGSLYSVNSAGTKVQSFPLAVSPGIIEGPLVDSTSQKVYVFVQVDTNTSGSLSCQNTSGCNGVYQLPTTFTASTSWNESVMGVGTTLPVYTGAFDNQYYTSENTNPTTPTGNLYACGTFGGAVNEPKLMDATIAAGVFTPEATTSSKGSSDGHGTVYFATNVAKPMTSAAATCSPVTEVDDGTNDWIFMSVTTSGSLAATTTSTCTGACIYSWKTTSTLAFEGTGSTVTQPTQGLTATGGTGGIIIDNTSSQTGASQIYFGTLGSQSCDGNGLGMGTGSTGGCAVQASQNGLN